MNWQITIYTCTMYCLVSLKTEHRVQYSLLVNQQINKGMNIVAHEDLKPRLIQANITSFRNFHCHQYIRTAHVKLSINATSHSQESATPTYYVLYSHTHKGQVVDLHNAGTPVLGYSDKQTIVCGHYPLYANFPSLNSIFISLMFTVFYNEKLLNLNTIYNIQLLY